MKIPARYSNILFGGMLSIIMVSIISGTVVLINQGYDADFFSRWFRGFATAWPVARRLGLAYSVFILINILPPLAMGGLLSAGRFSSVLFPSFLWFAGVVPPQQRSGWIATFAAVQALNAALFYTWRPLF